MQLKDWMDENQRNAVWVGNKINEPAYQVRRLCKGVGITAKIIFDISKLTKGAVNINDWVALEKKRVDQKRKQQQKEIKNEN